MNHDPIVDEVRRARDNYAVRFNYDLRAIFLDLKEQEKRSGRQFVSYAARISELNPNQLLGPDGSPTLVSDNLTIR